MKVSLHYQSGWVRDRVRSCKECKVLADNDTAFLCGWHENLAAADKAVAAQAEYDDDPELQNLLERAAQSETRHRSDLLDGDR